MIQTHVFPLNPPTPPCKTFQLMGQQNSQREHKGIYIPLEHFKCQLTSTKEKKTQKGKSKGKKDKLTQKRKIFSLFSHNKKIYSKNYASK